MKRLLVTLSILLGLPGAASAQNRAYLAQVRQDLDGDGKRDQVRVLPTGAVEIRYGKARKLGVVATELDGLKPRAGSIEVVAGARFGLRHLVVARVLASRKNRAPGVAVVLGFSKSGHDTLWQGSIGAQGSDREWSRRLAITRRGLELYEERPELTTCSGRAPIPLYARAFDFKNRKFRPYRIKNALPPGSIELTITTTAPKGAPAGPRAAFLRAVGATSRRGAGSASGLSVPRAIDDGNPATAWIEGRGGTGTGEQILFRQSSPPEAITALAILPGHGASADEFKNRGRVASFGLILSDGSNTISYRIKVPRDPTRLGPNGHRTYHWALLPEPVAASCGQLVLLTSYRGASARGKRDDIAIAEVHLLTAAELGSDLEVALARRVAAGGRR
ncbi:MAG: hypothetical protein KJO07_06705, partial [Deltaproteobacteria bacterium]|nr:hypothetical protein [Deltaproteobacteria bacterium]